MWGWSPAPVNKRLDEENSDKGENEVKKSQYSRHDEEQPSQFKGTASRDATVSRVVVQKTSLAAA